MSEAKVVTQNKGVGFLGLLALLFIGLKLGGIAPVATWSWWLVLLPLYGPLAAFLAAFAVLAAVFGVAVGISALSQRRR